ncbi:NACHT domain-containing protein [Specibacter sp. NPDC057265]|uniref:NACHT domain-containing protein n=1 Tax=Specibacter sp. NPDC057265 TaxID=3346075 RepID=UPI00363360FD
MNVSAAEHAAIPRLVVDRWEPKLRNGADSDVDFDLYSLESGFLDTSRVDECCNVDRAPTYLSEVVSKHSVVFLLGEPGIGKSVASNQVSQTVASNPECQLVELHAQDIDASRQTTREALNEYFAELPVRTIANAPVDSLACQSERSETNLVVVVDQVDESGKSARLLDWIAKLLQPVSLQNVLILVVCRTADFPTGANDSFARAGISTKTVDLLPMTVEQATSMAAFCLSSSLSHAADFIQQVADRGLGALGSYPLTLIMLARIFESDEELPDELLHVFHRAAAVLLKGYNGDSSGMRNSSFSTEELLLVAEQLAAISLISSQLTMHESGVQISADHRWPAESIVGRQLSIGDAGLLVSNEIVIQVLRSPLFIGSQTSGFIFRHGSIMAFLAAKRIVDSGIPEEQLRQILVPAHLPKESRIATPHRELASWLVAMDSDRNGWILDADPLTIIEHARLISSDQVRTMVVKVLLENAGDYELSNLRWQRNFNFLNFDGIGTVLNDAYIHFRSLGDSSWDTAAGLRLVLRLMEQLPEPTFLPALLATLDNEEVPAHIRAHAARVAWDISVEETRSTARTVLGSLATREGILAADRFDELRGQLLTQMYPTDLDAAELCLHLSLPANPDMFGVLTHFILGLSDRIPAEHIDKLLKWLASAVATDFESVESASSLADQPLVTPSHTIRAQIINRALELPLSEEAMGNVARTIVHSLDGDDPVGLWKEVLPETIRRRLIISLARAAADGGGSKGGLWYLAHLIANTRLQSKQRNWEIVVAPDEFAVESNLLSPLDLEWLLGIGAGLSVSESDLADVIDAFVFAIAITDNPRVIELLWPHSGKRYAKSACGYFEAIEIDSMEAKELRERHEYVKKLGRRQWRGRVGFVEKWTASSDDLLAAGPGSDALVYANLINAMMVDLETGRYSFDRTDDITSFPGWGKLASVDTGLWVEASRSYLEISHDHSDESLETRVDNIYATAGYVALVVLIQTGCEDKMEDIAWAKWCGSIVTFWATSRDESARKRRQALLKLGLTNAPEAFMSALRRCIGTETQWRSYSEEIELLDTAWHPPILELWCSLEEQIRDSGGSKRPMEVAEGQTDTTDLDHDWSMKLMTWHAIVKKIVDSEPARGLTLLERIVKSDNENSRSWTIEAASSLFAVGTDASWQVIQQAARTDEALSRGIALAAARPRQFLPSTTTFSPSTLRGQYDWLDGLFPRVPVHSGVHTVSAEEEAGRWRDSLPAQIAAAGTAEALAQLKDLHLRSPEDLTVRAALLEIRDRLSESEWQQPTPGEVISLLASPNRRFARTDAELASVIHQVIVELESSQSILADLLWNMVPKNYTDEGIGELWQPKSEAAMCAYLAFALDLHFRNTAVIVNREVMIKPTNHQGAGERTDLYVQSRYINDVGTSGPANEAKVVIEVKGSWNAGLLSSQETQLSSRYLSEVDGVAGIYVVFCASPEQWTDTSDHRLTSARRLNLDGVAANLKDQAQQLLVDRGHYVIPILFRMARPTATTYATTTMAIQ